MIYKGIIFKADPFSYNLEFDDRITLVGGDSGTGKTFLYGLLKDIRLTEEYNAIKLFNYKSDDFLEAIKQCRNNFIVIDNADCLINDDVRRFINFEISDRRVFQNRTYADFQQLELSSFVEMDTVHSASGSSKTLLTFFFTREKLFLAFLMNRNTEGAVRLIFDRLEKRFGTYDFQTLFEYILTDRGSEFGDPESLETGFTGIQRTSIYYCDPMRSGQKGGLEQAHTMLRMILPKKTNFEFLTQWDVNLIVSHINSTPRESLQGRTPYDVALETLGEETLKAFQLRRIAPDEVNLTPKLIRFTR